MFSLFAAWFPGGATLSPPCVGSLPAPRRTRLGVSSYSAASSSHSQRDRKAFQRPCPCSYTCSRVPAPADRRLDFAGYHVSSMSGSTRPRTPGSISATRHCAAPVVACRGGQTRRHSPTKTFGAQHLQGRLHPLPLHLACLFRLRIDSPVTRRAVRVETAITEPSLPTDQDVTNSVNRFLGDQERNTTPDT